MQKYTFSIANGASLTFNASGTYLWYYASGAAADVLNFSVQDKDGNRLVTLNSLLAGLRVKELPRFESILVTNTSGGTISGTLIIGGAEGGVLESGNLTIVGAVGVYESLTYLQANQITQTINTANQVLQNVVSGGKIQRIENSKNSANYMVVTDAGGNVLSILAPGDVIYLPYYAQYYGNAEAGTITYFSQVYT